MSKPARLPLFDDVEDQKSIQPKQTRDDVEFRKQRRRNRKKVAPLAPMPASGPCCGRCAHWHRPLSDDDGYGKCPVLLVATDRSPSYGIEKGAVHDRDMLRNAGLAGEQLRTGPAFCCGNYRAIEEQAA